jgi:cyclopropane-fatty-acyl-phospholipid synthase
MIMLLTKVPRVSKYHQLVSNYLAEADIRINGPEAWDVRVRDERFFRRVYQEGSLGLGESYVEGWWECAALDAFFMRLLRARLDERHRSSSDWWMMLSARLINRQATSRVGEVARRHYDLDPELYRAMLGDDRV